LRNPCITPARVKSGVSPVSSARASQWKKPCSAVLRTSVRKLGDSAGKSRIGGFALERIADAYADGIVDLLRQIESWPVSGAKSALRKCNRRSWGSASFLRLWRGARIVRFETADFVDEFRYVANSLYTEAKRT